MWELAGDADRHRDRGLCRRGAGGGGLRVADCPPGPGPLLGGDQPADFAQSISGDKLAQEAWRQAWAFGTTFVYMRQATSLSRNGGHYQLHLSDGSLVAARTVIIATGAAYRRLGIPALEHLQGRGVFYGTAASEAPAMRGRHVFVAGGGNCAGQAALHLAKWAAQVTILVRAPYLTCWFALRRERFCTRRRHVARVPLDWYMVCAWLAFSPTEGGKVTCSDGQSQDLPAGAGRVRPGGVARVVIALMAAVAFGAVDQYLPAAIPLSSHLGASLFAAEVSKMSAPWLLVAFLAGAWQGGQRRAALVGLAATWLAVLAYVLMIVSPIEGARLTPGTAAASLASQWPWFAGGLITGPLYGWLGYRWRARRSAAAALLAALPILVEPAARWLATRLGLSGTGWLLFPWPPRGSGVAAQFAELAAGLLLTGAAIKVIAHGRAPEKA